MKNKKNIYVLLPLVLILWGVIGYKIFKGMNADNLPMATSPKLLPTSKIDTLRHEIAQVSGNYRDPFLGTYTLKKIPNNRSRRNSQVRKDTVEFPEIAYKGYMTSDVDSKTTYMLVIDGQQVMLKKGETHNQIKLIKGNSTSVRLKYRTKKKEFLLTK